MLCRGIPTSHLLQAVKRNSGDVLEKAHLYRRVSSSYYSCRVVFLASATVSNMRCNHIHTGSKPGTDAQMATTSTDDAERPRPIGDMPGPRIVPVFGSAIPVWRNVGRLFDFMCEQAKKYGGIYKGKLGPNYTVNVSDANIIQEFYRREEKLPHRYAVEPWKYWKEKRGKKLGIFLINGPEWKKVRSVLDKQMMKPSHATTYVSKIYDVNKSFLCRLRRMRADDMSVPNMDMELFNWSLENIVNIVYEKRMGAFSSKVKPEIQVFIDAVNTVFRITAYLMIRPPFLYNIIARKQWKEFDAAWTVIYETGQQLIDERLQTLKQQIESSEEVEESFLASILGDDKLSLEEVYANITELMTAAVDTTSNTMQMVMYYIARHPDVQEKIRTEIYDVTGKDPTKPISQADLNNLKYLRAAIREVQRFFPLALGGWRKLTEGMVLAGYKLPAGTGVSVNPIPSSMAEENFPDPLIFRPERWLRDTGERATIHPFASLPFGYGQRSCIGRRVAEMELQLLLAQLLREFVMEPVDDKPIELANRLVWVPKEPVRVKFKDLPL